MRSSRFDRLLARAFLIVGAVAASAIAVEAAARLYIRYAASDDQALQLATVAQLEKREGVAPRLSPHRFLGYYPTPGYRHRGNRHDRFGFRGDDIDQPKPPGRFRVVCLGGSAMYSDGVRDVRQSFPFLLQTALRQSSRGAIEVVNAAAPGYGSLESLINLQIRVLELEPDLIVVYHGINDLGARLVWPPESYRGDQAGSIRLSVDRRDHTLVGHSAIARILLTRLGWMEPQASLGHFLGTPPETAYRQTLARQVARGGYPSGRFASVPLEAMLAANPPTHFRRNLSNIVTLAEANGAHVMLLTFAFSTAGPWQGLIELPAIRSGLDEMNEVVRAVAEGHGTSFFDLAAALPDAPAFFTDGYHFTAAGNRARADLVAAAISEIRSSAPAAVAAQVDADVVAEDLPAR